MKAKKKETHMMVDAPEGHHWMMEKGRYYLMKDKDGKFTPHAGASKEAKFRLYQSHSR
jgi:hypothetical protein